MAALRDSRLLENGPDPDADSVCARVRERFDAAICVVTLLSSDQQKFFACSGISVDGTPRKQAFCNFAILSDDVFVVEDTAADPQFRTHPLVIGEPFIRFYAGAPLTIMPGLRFGALCVIDRRPRSFSLGDRAELAVFADEVVRILSRRSREAIRPDKPKPLT